jgi:hypothetical protein
MKDNTLYQNTLLVDASIGQIICRLDMITHSAEQDFTESPTLRDAKDLESIAKDIRKLYERIYHDYN